MNHYKFMIVADGNVDDEKFVDKIKGIFNTYKCKITHLDVIGRKMLPEPSTDIALYTSVDVLCENMTAVNEVILSDKNVVKTMVIKR